MGCGWGNREAHPFASTYNLVTCGAISRMYSEHVQRLRIPIKFPISVECGGHVSRKRIKKESPPVGGERVIVICAHGS